MTSVRRAIPVLCLVAVAGLFCGDLHAQGMAVKFCPPEPCVKAGPPPLAACLKQPCVTRPIWCPDDYGAKCPPRVCPPKYCGTRDCYDAKCPPCVCPPKYCGTRECYTAKCPPCLRIPCRFPSFYKCAPPPCFGNPTSRSSVQK